MKSHPRHSSAGKAIWPQAGLKPHPPVECRLEGRRLSSPPLLTPLTTNKISLWSLTAFCILFLRIKMISDIPDWDRPSLKPIKVSSSVIVLPVRLQWVSPSTYTKWDKDQRAYEEESCIMWLLTISILIVCIFQHLCPSVFISFGELNDCHQIRLNFCNQNLQKLPFKRKRRKWLKETNCEIRNRGEREEDGSTAATFTVASVL